MLHLETLSPHRGTVKVEQRWGKKLRVVRLVSANITWIKFSFLTRSKEQAIPVTRLSPCTFVRFKDANYSKVFTFLRVKRLSARKERTLHGIACLALKLRWKEMEKKGFKNPTNILFIGSLNNISTGTNKRLYFLTFSNEQEVSLQYLSAACSLPTQEEETRCNQKTTLLESFCLRAPCKSKGKGCQQTVLNYWRSILLQWIGEMPGKSKVLHLCFRYNIHCILSATRHLTVLSYHT